MMRRSVVTILGAACALCLSLAVGVASATAGEPGLAALKAAGVLRVGIASDPPFTFQEANGEWKSFNPELIHGICPMRSPAKMILIETESF